MLPVKLKKSRVCEVALEKKEEGEVTFLLTEIETDTIGLLTIYKCDLRTIPRRLERQRGSLKGLSLKDNKITTSGCNFSPIDLLYLKYLDLSNNCLNGLHESAVTLVNLQVIKLDDNHIKKIPGLLTALPKLETFSLMGNPLEEEPEYFGSFLRHREFDLQKKNYSLKWRKIEEIYNHPSKSSQRARKDEGYKRVETKNLYSYLSNSTTDKVKNNSPDLILETQNSYSSLINIYSNIGKELNSTQQVLQLTESLNCLTLSNPGDPGGNQRAWPEKQSDEGLNPGLHSD